MRYVVDWIKANPVSVASLVVIVASLTIIGYFWSQGGELREHIADGATQIREVQNMRSQSRTIPAENPDDPPQRVDVVINEKTLADLERLYGQLQTEGSGVFDFAQQINQEGHPPLEEDLFPEPPSGQYNLPYEAAETYRTILANLFRPGGAAESQQIEGWPTLNAGMPPSESEIEEAMQQLESDLRARLGNTAQIGDLQEDQIQQTKQQRLLDLLTNRAKSLDLYAQPRIEASDFALDVGQWSEAGESPPIDQLWEGQLELWIQSDIVRAIAQANRADEPDANVTNAPFKRLIELEIIPGYVGLHTIGGVRQGGGSRSSGSVSRGGKSVYPAPQGGLTDEGDAAIPRNFFAGPTGRVSNGLYDVRHVRLVGIVDAQQLPEIYKAIETTNFMTVLSCNIQGIDEYEHLQENYVYGTGDAVQVEMVIESIWLRAWTRPEMPSLTRQYLGIDKPTDLEEAREGPPDQGDYPSDMYGPPPGF
ncbi:MAG: hypothetical protein ACOCTI_06620 [Phycisphaeraceae bacterium]